MTHLFTNWARLYESFPKKRSRKSKTIEVYIKINILLQQLSQAQTYFLTLVSYETENMSQNVF